MAIDKNTSESEIESFKMSFVNVNWMKMITADISIMFSIQGSIAH